MKTISLVVWFEIYVDDLKRANKFYDAMLKLELSELSMPNTSKEIQIFFSIEMD